MAVTKKVFQVVVHDDVDIFANEFVLAVNANSARDKAVQKLGEDIDLDNVVIVVTPLGGNSF